uniref:Uncharacterized protein n=1 Tax=Fagus sylvatica TaxID=28930 RepID=A0A2N9ILX9_FAGSY
MEDVRTRADTSIARNLQAELDAKAVGLASGAAQPSSRPGITIGRSARPSGAPRQPTAAPTVAPPAKSKRQRSDRAPPSADPIPEDYIAPGFRYPPRGGIRPRHCRHRRKIRPLKRKKGVRERVKTSWGRDSDAIERLTRISTPP